METKDALQLGYGIGMGVGTVIGGHDKLGRSSVLVGAPVFDVTIGTVRRVTTSLVTDDGVGQEFTNLCKSFDVDIRIAHATNGPAREET